MEIEQLSERLHDIAAELASSGAVLSADAAAHAWIMRATGTWHGEPVRYLALPTGVPRAIVPSGAVPPPGVRPDAGPVVEVLQAALPLYSTTLRLPHGPEIPVLTREAVLAQLLARGGIAIALAGLLLRAAPEPPIDPDVVREILKAARLGDRFQPLLELLAA